MQSSATHLRWELSAHRSFPRRTPFSSKIPSVRRATAVSLLLLAFGLTGCGKDEFADKTKLRYMAWGNPEQLALEQEMCEDFNRQNPDIHVSFVRVPASAYKNKMVVMFASRTSADVVRVDHYNFPQLVKKDYFYDMTSLAEKDPTFKSSDFFPQCIEEETVNGRMYGMNVLFGGILVYYNKTMLKDAGLEDPYELSQKGQWTWDRYREYAIKMTKFGPNGKPLKFGTQSPGMPVNLIPIWAFGGDLMTPDFKHSRLGDPNTIRAIQFLHDLPWKDHCSPNPAEAANGAFTFESGKLGMSFDFMGVSPTYRKKVKDFEWDVCPVPSGPHGGVSLVKGNQLVIYRETEHPQEAWRFVRFMTSVGTEQKLYGRLLRCFPTRRAVAYSKEYLHTDQAPHHMDSFVSTVEHGRPLPITSRWDEQLTLVTSAMEEINHVPDPDIPAILKRTQSKIDKMLGEEEGW